MILLLTLAVLLRGDPVPHAYVQCAGIVRHVEDGESDDANDGNGAVLLTDSRGHMVIQGVPGEYQCRAWKDGVGVWSGTLQVTRKETFRLPLQPPLP